ncbi:putative CH domain superfamily protein [Helianthus anomalus]
MAVDNSSSSPTFRELDDVFLQSQARIWLGEVLRTRFDEQISIGDLLSDGELLFEVSKALWNMLLLKYMELKNYKARMFVPVDTRKSIGRYRPYANVDSFLKASYKKLVTVFVCKVMGLSGVDLFSPSDVVEKKNTRKVCVCIRSLSTKARSKRLNVPDFDVVTSTVAMSTDAVRCIRRSLELSSMSSVTCGPSNHARLKSRQKTSAASDIQEEESYLEESDEENSHFSDTSYVDFLYLESEESPDTADKYALNQSIQQSDASNRELNKLAHSPVSVLMQYVNTENQLDETLSICRVWRKLPDDAEASLTSSVFGRVLDFDFDFDAKSESDDLTTSEFSTYEHVDHGSLNNTKTDSGHLLVSVKDDVTSIADSMQENVAGKESNDKLMKMDDPKLTDDIDDVFDDPSSVKFSERYDSCAEDTSKAATKDERKDDSLAKAGTEEKNVTRAFNSEKKPYFMAPLIKTVAKGTALIGFMFLLHLRNRSPGNTSQIHWKSSGVGFLKMKEEKGSKIYPVDKFKFED